MDSRPLGYLSGPYGIGPLFTWSSAWAGGYFHPAAEQSGEIGESSSSATSASRPAPQSNRRSTPPPAYSEVDEEPALKPFPVGRRSNEQYEQGDDDERSTISSSSASAAPPPEQSVRGVWTHKLLAKTLDLHWAQLKVNTRRR